jgi:deoxyribodipyrimidine photo-lyase
VPLFNLKEENGSNAAIKSLFFEQNLSVYKETRNGMVGKVLFKIFGLLYGLYFRTIYKVRAYEKENGANDSTYWLILNYYA